MFHYFKFNILVSVFIFVLFGSTAFSQKDHEEFNLNFPSSLNEIESASSISTYKIIAFLFPLNPIFLVEDKRFYAGITKEFSIGAFPYGRAAAEYSLIFRKTRLNQLRFSYNFDIPLEVSDFGAFMLTVGAGYFTDFYKEGFFPQASLNIMLPFNDNIGINAYIKFRNTFVTDDNESDIFDFSLGLATFVYL
ncbi:MAG: hypothetical protein IPL53_09175 [Ignavibacteria bacterium]|nr:hypothetical protein [Ignavibacteria bacterium]